MSLPALCPVAQDSTFHDIVTAVGLSMGVSVHSNKLTLSSWLAKGLSVAESFERSLDSAGLIPSASLRYLIACLAPQVPTGALIEQVERMLKLSIQGKWFFPVTPFDMSLLSITLEDLITAHLPDVAQHLSSINCSAAALLSPLMQRLMAGSLPVAASCDIARACLAGQGPVALTRAACCLLVWHRNELLACTDMHDATKVLAPSGRGKQQHSIRASLPNMGEEQVRPFVAGPFSVHLSAAAAGVSPALGKHDSESVLGHAEFALQVRYLLHKNIFLSRVIRLPFGAPPLVRRGAPTMGAIAPAVNQSTRTARNQLSTHVPSQHVLQLRSYHWVGFDLDHTLAQYNDALVAQHIVYAALAQLYSKFPAEVTHSRQAAWRASNAPAAAAAAAPSGEVRGAPAGSTRQTSSSLTSIASDASAESASGLPECMQPHVPGTVIAALHRRYRADARRSTLPDGPTSRSRRPSLGGRGTSHRNPDASTAQAAQGATAVGVDSGSASTFVLNTGPEPLWLHLCEAGVVLDRVLGNVLWVDANAHVKLAFHGNCAIGHAELMQLYPAQTDTTAPNSTVNVPGAVPGIQQYGEATQYVRSALPGLVPRLPAADFPPSQPYSPADPTGGARFMVAHTGFDAPLAAVFALLVQEADTWAKGLSAPPPADYSRLFAAAAEAVRFTYTRFASIGFPAVLANVTPFLHMGGRPAASAAAAPTGRASSRRSMQPADSAVGGSALPPAAYNKVPKAVKQAAGKALFSWLRDLRTADVRRSVDGQPETAAGHVRTFLMTNADFDHARTVLCSLLGPTWQDAFDLVVVSARKKSMFQAAPAQLASSAAAAELAPFKSVDAASGRARALTKASLGALVAPPSAVAGSAPAPPHGRLVRVASLSSPRHTSRTNSIASEGSEGGLSAGSDAPGNAFEFKSRRTISAERGAGGGVMGPLAGRIRSFDSQDSIASSLTATGEHVAAGGAGASPLHRPSPLAGPAQQWSPQLRRLSRTDDFVPASGVDAAFPGLGPPAVEAVSPPVAAGGAAGQVWGSSPPSTTAAPPLAPRSRLERKNSMVSMGPKPLNLSKGTLFSGGNIPQLLATMAQCCGVRRTSAVRVLYVGDHASTDIQLAGQLGWHTLAISKRLSFAMAAEACHKEHVAAAGAAATAAAASFVAPAASASGRRSSLSMAWMRPKSQPQRGSISASEGGLSAGHPLLLALTSRNAGALSAQAQGDVRQRARTLSKLPQSVLSAAEDDLAISRSAAPSVSAAPGQGGAAAADDQAGDDAPVQPAEDSRDPAVCDVMACRSWSALPAYAWNEGSACFTTSVRGQAGHSASRGRGLGQSQQAFWPLSVHAAASDVAVTGPDSPFGHCGMSPTWIEGLALSSPNCKGVIPSVHWLARALPLPSAKGSNGGSRTSIPLPRKRLSGVQPSGRGVVEMHAPVKCEFGPEGADTLSPQAVRQGCGFPEEMSFAFGMGAEPPPGMLRQAFTRCYSAVPPALERSPFAVQVVQGGDGMQVLGPPRPAPTAADVLTAATYVPVASRGIQMPWSGDVLLLHLRCSENELPWLHGMWRWHTAWAASMYPWPQHDWSEALAAPSPAGGASSFSDNQSQASASGGDESEDEGDPS